MSEHFKVHATVFGITPDAVAAEIASAVSKFERIPDVSRGLWLYWSGEVTLEIIAEDENTLAVSLYGQQNWQSDPAFARYLSGRLDCCAICDPGPEFPEVDAASDVFLEVAHGRERLLTLG